LNSILIEQTDYVELGWFDNEKDGCDFGGVKRENDLYSTLVHKRVLGQIFYLVGKASTPGCEGFQLHRGRQPFSVMIDTRQSD